jgi:hypothetical protein
VLVFGAHFVQQFFHAKTLAVAFVEGFQVIACWDVAHGKCSDECGGNGRLPAHDGQSIGSIGRERRAFYVAEDDRSNLLIRTSL